MHKFSVTFVLYLFEADICLPSFIHLTKTFGLPTKVQSSIKCFPFSIEMSLRLFTKRAGSEKGIKKLNVTKISRLNCNYDCA